LPHLSPDIHPENPYISSRFNSGVLARLMLHRGVKTVTGRNESLPPKHYQEEAMRILLAFIFALVLGGPLSAVETAKPTTSTTTVSEKAKPAKKHVSHKKIAKKTSVKPVSESTAKTVSGTAKP
jgi:hypothetical protein